MTVLHIDVAANLARLRERIARACERSGRSPQDITIVAVTKEAGVPSIMAAFADGLREFGENRVQDAQDKMDVLAALRPSITWHMIGRLQTNKARKVVQLFDVVQSVDSVRLAENLNKYAERPLPVLLQVNVAREPTKTGFAPEEVTAAFQAISRLPNLEVRGLMTIAPVSDNPEAVRPVFRELRLLRDALGLQHLSMGMTDDFEVAIEEGATIVRIGRAIFRQRD